MNIHKINEYRIIFVKYYYKYFLAIFSVLFLLLIFYFSFPRELEREKERSVNHISIVFVWHIHKLIMRRLTNFVLFFFFRFKHLTSIFKFFFSTSIFFGYHYHFNIKKKSRKRKEWCERKHFIKINENEFNMIKAIILKRDI